MKKYSIGINQWLGSIKQIYKTRDVYKKIKNQPYIEINTKIKLCYYSFKNTYK